MKPKKLLLIVNIILLLFLFMGCKDSLPVYKTRNFNDDQKVCVIIDGIEYKMYPALKWMPLHNDRIVIGYAGSRGRSIFCLESDTERNFIYIGDSKITIIGARGRILHRTDIDIPNPSESSVDKIVFEEQDNRKGEMKVTENIITDKEVIKELFDTFKNGDKTAMAFGIDNYYISLSCYSDEVPGMGYWFNIEISDEEILLGNNYEGYAAIPESLLIKLAGHEIDVDELLAEGQE